MGPRTCRNVERFRDGMREREGHGENKRNRERKREGEGQRERGRETGSDIVEEKWSATREHC